MYFLAGYQNMEKLGGHKAGNWCSLWQSRKVSVFELFPVVHLLAKRGPLTLPHLSHYCCISKILCGLGTQPSSKGTAWQMFISIWESLQSRDVELLAPASLYPPTTPPMARVKISERKQCKTRTVSTLEAMESIFDVQPFNQECKGCRRFGQQLIG